MPQPKKTRGLRGLAVPQTVDVKRGRVRVTINHVEPSMMFAAVQVGSFKQRTAMVEFNEVHTLMNDILQILGFVPDVRVAEYEC